MTSTAAYRALHREVQASLSEAPAAAPRVVLGFFAHALVGGLGALAYFLAPTAPSGALGLLFACLGAIGVAAHAHTAGHFAASPRRGVNQWLRFLGHPFYVGLSADYWRRSHNRHHHAPNVVGIDPDVDQWPLFQIVRPAPAEVGRLRAWYYRRVQGWVAPVAMAFTFFAMIADGLVHFTRAGRERHLDACALLGHAGVWYVLPGLQVGWGPTLVFNAVRTVALGYAAIAFIGPGHLPHSSACAAARSPDPLLRHAATTTDFVLGPVARLFSAGLEHHVAHHLFPNVPHVHLARIRPVVERFCRVHGYPYRRRPWGSVMQDSLRTFFRPKPIMTTLPSDPDQEPG